MRKKVIDQNSVTIHDIAGYCMVSTTTVRRWIHNNQLHALVLPSGRFRINTDDFKDFLSKYHIPISGELISELK